MTEHSRFGPQDFHLFNEGTHARLYDHLGAHPEVVDGVAGVNFAVWAPNVDHVSVVGDFNDWQRGADALVQRGEFTGIWEGFIPGVQVGAIYKFHLNNPTNGYRVEKADPFGVQHQIPPATASVVARLDYTWNDEAWLKARRPRVHHREPMSVYEVHLGSWMRVPEDGDRSLTYREVAPKLADYALEHGFTHVELLPLMEHPYYPSWGYQTTGYFAPTSRYGGPTDFMYLVDTLHQAGVGVILDWVPSHFPTDEHGLGYFDGTHLFEHEDPDQGFHPDWKSSIFNYERHEVRAFLVSSAMSWIDRFHIDGLRVDAVASMLYLDYSRAEGAWIPNRFGGRENLAAIDFLKQLNKSVHDRFPDVFTVAEESTSWPLVSRPLDVGGLGFDFKWDMGWMHDTLGYMARDPVHRKFHHSELTFRGMYQFSENFVLPLSHDEVVHLKGSLIEKMPGDEWQRFANLRLLLANMWTQPGKKLLFMGAEIAQWREWSHDRSLDWDLLERPLHRGILNLVGALNRMYREVPALYARDCEPEGFRWVDAHNMLDSVTSYLRMGPKPEDVVIVAFNHTPEPRHDHVLGVPYGGTWTEVLNTDAESFGGSGLGNLGAVQTESWGSHGFPHVLKLTLPPLAAVVLRCDPAAVPEELPPDVA